MLALGNHLPSLGHPSETQSSLADSTRAVVTAALIANSRVVFDVLLLLLLFPLRLFSATNPNHNPTHDPRPQPPSPTQTPNLSPNPP